MLLVQTRQLGRVARNTLIVTVPAQFTTAEDLRPGDQIAVGVQGHLLIVAPKKFEAEVLELVAARQRGGAILTELTGDRERLQRVARSSQAPLELKAAIEALPEATGPSSRWLVVEGLARIAARSNSVGNPGNGL